MEKTEIGIVTINYSPGGRVRKADFVPTMNLTATQELLEQLKSVRGSKDQEEVINNAQLVFSAWFAKLNNVELADRQQYEIVTEVISCKQYRVKKTIEECKIKFVFQPIAVKEVL